MFIYLIVIFDHVFYCDVCRADELESMSHSGCIAMAMFCIIYLMHTAKKIVADCIKLLCGTVNFINNHHSHIFFGRVDDFSIVHVHFVFC